jgi:hypothetical protein
MKTPLLLGSMMLASAAFGQLYVEGFEGYAAGDYVTTNNPVWITWENLPGTDQDGLITNSEAHSGSNSLNIIGMNGPMDVVMVAGDLSSGSYECNWWMKIPANYAGYYNVQEFSAPGVAWAFEAFFAEDGTFEYVMDNNTVATGEYPVDGWFELKHQVDLDNDFIQIYMNDVWMGAWTFDSNIVGVNFYGTGSATAVGNWFLDDITVQEATFTLSTAEVAPQLELAFGPNPATNSINILGNVDQALVRVLGLNGRLVYEQRLSGLHRGAQLELNLVDGIYFIELSDGDRRTTQRLVIQH